MYCKQIIIAVTAMLVGYNSIAQLSGSIESNSALYIDDAKIKLASNEADNKIRNNTYLRLDYKHKQFTIGVQAESYLPKALLNYAPNYKNVGIGTAYINYRNDSLRIDATVGHFYEQFGSGLVLRAWEDRQLGVANSILGAKLNIRTYEPLNVTLLYGKQRNGFDVTEGTIAGINAELDIATILKAKKWHYAIGGSFVNRKETLQPSLNLPENTQLTSLRANLKKGAISIDAEYAFKTAEPLIENGVPQPNFRFDGDVYLLNIGFAKPRIGINANFRRTENFTVYSQQNLYGNAFNQGLLTYAPALTKQYDYSLTNIYVYMAQSRLTFNPIATKAGEIGGQIDVFYKLKPKSFLGGKYGTQIALNAAKWNSLSGKYDAALRKYQTNLLQPGADYYQELGVEIRKKWSDGFSNSLTYTNQFYSAVQIEETFGEVRTNTVVLDNTFSLPKGKSLRIDAQHQWASAIHGNWLGVSAEYSFNSKWACFATDLYNYGNEDGNKQLHYYVAGLAYRPGAFRAQISYGRQRGGLQCIGGICRFVSENAGLSFTLNYSF
jgi:Family of unknown function (DUF6029)